MDLEVFVDEMSVEAVEQNDQSGEMMYGKDLDSSLLPTCIITNMILIQDDPGPG